MNINETSGLDTIKLLLLVIAVVLGIGLIL